MIIIFKSLNTILSPSSLTRLYTGIFLKQAAQHSGEVSSDWRGAAQVWLLLCIFRKDDSNSTQWKDYTGHYLKSSGPQVVYSNYYTSSCETNLIFHFCIFICFVCVCVKGEINFGCNSLSTNHLPPYFLGQGRSVRPGAEYKSASSSPMPKFQVGITLPGY